MKLMANSGGGFNLISTLLNRLMFNNSMLLLLTANFLFFSVDSYSQQPAIKWWFDTKDASYGQSAAADVDGDGKLEIAFGCYRNDSMVYVLNAEDGSLLWKYNTAAGSQGCNDTAPILFDIDGDNIPEVIVPSSCTASTFCFDGKTGNVKWKCKTDGSDSPPTIADIDGDGLMEILHGEFGGHVISIDLKSGARNWNFPVDSNSWVQTAPTILDADGDGNLDWVVGTWNLKDRTQSKIAMYRGKDLSLMWSRLTSSYIYHGSAVADLDDDGKPEIVIGSYNDTLYCLNSEDGSLDWKFYGGGGYIGSPASIADIDNDGACDVVMTSGSRIIALTKRGSQIWKYRLSGAETCFRGVALADVNNDEYLDVVFGTSGGKLTALNGKTGLELWNINLAQHSGITSFAFDHSPLLADFDGNGTLDVFIVGGYSTYPDVKNNVGRAYMLSIAKARGPNLLMFQRDIRRQSSLCSPPVSSVESESVPNQNNPNTVSIDGDRIKVYPRFNSTPHSIALYSALGQCVFVQRTDAQEITINSSDFSTGLYFLRVDETVKRIIIQSK